MRSSIFILGVLVLFAGCLYHPAQDNVDNVINDQQMEEVNKDIDDVEETQRVVDEGTDIEDDLAIGDSDDLDDTAELDDIDDDLAELDELENLDDFDFSFS